MSRRFDGANDEVRYPITTGFTMGGAFTLMVVFRRRATGAQHTLLSLQTSAAARLTLAVDSSGTGWLNSISDSAQGALFTNTTDWWFFAANKASGTAPVLFHYKNLTAGSAMVHGSGSTLANATADSTMVCVGEQADASDANINVAIDAAWASALSNANLDTIINPNSTQGFLDFHAGTAGAWLHEHNQASATEDIDDLFSNAHTATGLIDGGNSDASGIDGTTMEADDPPSWTYLSTTPVQEIRPDADTTTTGWTTTPLWSKVNDESDSTVVTGTLA